MKCLSVVSADCGLSHIFKTYSSHTTANPARNLFAKDWIIYVTANFQILFTGVETVWGSFAKREDYSVRIQLQMRRSLHISSDFLSRERRNLINFLYAELTGAGRSCFLFHFHLEISRFRITVILLKGTSRCKQTRQTQKFFRFLRNLRLSRI